MIAISFLFIFLFANTEAGQLFKLPVLIHHYLEHHDEDAGVSLTDFLYKHYNEERSRSASDTEHDKLPFKNADIGFSQITLIQQSPIVFEIKPDKPVSTKEINIHSTIFLSSSHLSRIWQPPKTV